MPSPSILMAKVHKSVGFGSAAHCNGDVNDDENQKKNTLQCVNSYRNKDFQCKPISDSKFNLSTFFSTLHKKASTSLSVLEYLVVSTRVLGLKYCSTCKEVLIVTCSVLKKVSFPDFSRRFFASLAEKIYTFSIAILSRFTLSPIPCCSA